MKKFKLISLVLSILMILSLLAACAQGGNDTSDTTTAGNVDNVDTTTAAPDDSTPADDVTIRVGGMTGPTSIGLVKLMQDNEAGTSKNKYDFTVVGAADEITPKLIQGELDIAALPANLASVLYNNTEGKVKLLAINTLGVLYIVQKGETVTSVADLKGKTIYATGKGSTPEYTLRHILTQNGIDPDKDVTIEFKSEPTEIVAVLKNGNGIAMLPQPYVTVAKSQVEGLETALDLTAEWDKIGNGTRLLTGTLVVRTEFAEAHPELIASFLEEYKASTEYVNANVEDAANLVEKFGIFKAAVAKVAIPQCNITFVAGEDLKPLIEGYLKVLFDQKPASVGGKLPDDNFYYINK
ncbi:MAG: ABC transporter substrate-binding protein [Clostridia bacterium]|nr:ABC transporter substrate-binding protein [Clostridia bacterium]